MLCATAKKRKKLSNPNVIQCIALYLFLLLAIFNATQTSNFITAPMPLP
jgi:hypothetical protein